jgi:hypothetical protein
LKYCRVKNLQSHNSSVLLCFGHFLIQTLPATGEKSYHQREVVDPDMRSRCRNVKNSDKKKMLALEGEL